MKSIKTSDGFTLLESLLSIVFLGIIAYGVSALYSSGYRALDEQADRMLLDSRIRGKMEELISKSFAEVGNGSEIVSVNGKDYTINWTSALTDLSGDSAPESNAKQVTVSVADLPNRSITTIIVDNEGALGKI